MNHDATKDRPMATVTRELPPFDHWVRSRLAERYRSVLREEVPREWLLLLEISSWGPGEQNVPPGN
jgi:hypothetical protein